MPSSNASSSCRIDWRPSRWLVLGLIVLAVLAAASLAMSALPTAQKLPACVLALLAGVRQSRLESLRPALRLDWPGGDAEAMLAGEGGVLSLRGVRAQVRGPLAVLTGRDGNGRTLRLAWWPDTLPPASRRALRLAAAVSPRSGKPLPQLAA